MFRFAGLLNAVLGEVLRLVLENAEKDLNVVGWNARLLLENFEIERKLLKEGLPLERLKTAAGAVGTAPVGTAAAAAAGENRSEKAEPPGPWLPASRPLGGRNFS